MDGKTSKEKPDPVLIVRSVDKDKSLPKETQMAQCTITSGDIKASAQATFSKKLEGFCSTSKLYITFLITYLSYFPLIIFWTF